MFVLRIFLNFRSKNYAFQMLFWFLHHFLFDRCHETRNFLLLKIRETLICLKTIAVRV